MAEIAKSLSDVTFMAYEAGRTLEIIKLEIIEDCLHACMMTLSSSF